MDLEIFEGDFTIIMGSSGSGKSTLLYALSGMDKPTSGDVYFDGNDIAKYKADDMAKVRLDEMGFIFQQMYMLKNLTILDNIILPACESKKSSE